MQTARLSFCKHNHLRPPIWHGLSWGRLCSPAWVAAPAWAAAPARGAAWVLQAALASSLWAPADAPGVPGAAGPRASSAAKPQQNASLSILIQGANCLNDLQIGLHRKGFGKIPVKDFCLC